MVPHQIAVERQVSMYAIRSVHLTGKSFFENNTTSASPQIASENAVEEHVPPDLTSPLQYNGWKGLQFEAIHFGLSSPGDRLSSTSRLRAADPAAESPIVYFSINYNAESDTT